MFAAFIIREVEAILLTSCCCCCSLFFFIRANTAWRDAAAQRRLRSRVIIKWAASFVVITADQGRLFFFAADGRFGIDVVRSRLFYYFTWNFEFFFFQTWLMIFERFYHFSGNYFFANHSFRQAAEYSFTTGISSHIVSYCAARQWLYVLRDLHSWVNISEVRKFTTFVKFMTTNALSLPAVEHFIAPLESNTRNE